MLETVELRAMARLSRQATRFQVIAACCSVVGAQKHASTDCYRSSIPFSADPGHARVLPGQTTFDDLLNHVMGCPV